VHGLHRRGFRHENSTATAIVRACEIDSLFAFRRDAHAADDHIELARTQACNDAVESGGHDNRLYIKALGDFGADIDVETDHLVLTINKTEWRENTAHADAQFTALLDLFEVVRMGGCEHHQCTDASGNERRQKGFHFIFS